MRNMIFFSDFDDTLYLSGDPAGTAHNLAAINPFRAKGHKFCLATGRSFASLKRGLPNFSDYADYVILDNGAICLNATGEEEFIFPIAVETVTRILDFIKTNFKDVETGEVFYSALAEQPSFNGPVTKFRCWVKDVETARPIVTRLLENFGHEIKAFVASSAQGSNMSWVRNDLHSLIDIAPIDAGKDRAIVKLANAIAPNEQIIVVGNSSNDNSMIKAFDGYAVASSEPETLAIVKEDHVVGSVADLLEKLTRES